jgi:hypothetical protein
MKDYPVLSLEENKILILLLKKEFENLVQCRCEYSVIEKADEEYYNHLTERIKKFKELIMSTGESLSIAKFLRNKK